MACPPPHFISEEHLSFAAHIVRSEFSPLMERLTTYMLTFGPTPLPELVRETGIAPTLDDGRPDPVGLALARNALLALMQQNIVSCPIPPIVDTSYVARKRRESGYLPPPVYAASLEEIFARLWFPRIVLTVRESLGDDEGLLIQNLLNYGRMSVESLVDRATVAYAASAHLGVDEPQVREKENALREAAKRLQTAKFIVNVEPLPLRPVRSGGAAAAAAGGAGASSCSSAAGGPSSSSASAGGRGGRKRAAAAAAPLVAEQPGGGGKAPAKRRKGSAAAQKAEAEAAALAAAAARAARAEAAAAATAAALALQPQVKLVRCALDRYRRELRQAAIQRFVSDKLDDSAAQIVKIVMEMQLNIRDQMGGLGAGDDDYHKLSPPFTIDALQARWSGAPSRKDIQQYLDLMCADPMCRMATALNGRYLLQLREIGACIKQLMLECAVRDKFGDVAFRVFRLLLLRKPSPGLSGGGTHVACKLELKQLAELALLPERDARPHLMTLLRHDYVLLQELPRTADHNPRTTTYLWHVDVEHAYRSLERDMFRTMGTLYGRMAHERRANAPALAAVQPQAAGMPLEHLSEAQHEEARVAQRKIDCLENALLQVHHTAMKMRAIA